MAISKAQQKATAKYVSKTYDRLEAKVPKGRKEAIQVHAEATDGTLNKFLNRAINETMARDSGGTVTGTSPQQPCGYVLSPESLEAAQAAAEAEGEDVASFLSRAIATQAERDTLSRKLKLLEKERPPLLRKLDELETPPEHQDQAEEEVPIDIRLAEALRKTSGLFLQRKAQGDSPDEESPALEPAEK